jgi:hypothetical protein
MFRSAKVPLILALALAITLVVFFSLRLLSGPEDTWLCVDGQWVKHGNPANPQPTEGCGVSDAELIHEQAESEADANIIVFEPLLDEEIGLPLVIRGEARVFENQLNYQIKDADGSILAEGTAYANAPDMGEYGIFEVAANYPEPKGQTGTVEVFDYSAKDGSRQDEVIVPVKFSSVEATEVKVYFGNKIKNPEALDCSQVFAVERRVAKTEGVARAALEELLKGITASEAEVGYFTSINDGVSIQKIEIKAGVATVDFDEILEAQVGGSCRVAAIRAQIEETLKQFSTVKKVVISINGRTEDILQP